MDADIAWSDIPELSLDTHSLPPLNALSTSSEALPQLDILDLLSIDSSTATTDLPTTPTSDTDTQPSSLSACTDSASEPSFDSSTPRKKPRSETCKSASAPQKADHSNHSELVLELTTRLSAAGVESSTLRKRVAHLTAENRSLRAALDHANARLLAVAQAAAAPTTIQAVPDAHGTPTLVLGMPIQNQSMAMPEATPSAVVIEEEPPRKKRKRVSGAATTMACVMFIWGALVGTPGLISNAYRSDGNLPAVWSKGGVNPGVNVPAVSGVARIKEEDMTWQPNCVRVMNVPQLPDGKEEGKIDEPPQDEMQVDSNTGNAAVKIEDKIIDDMYVNLDDSRAAKIVTNADVEDRRELRRPEYSYVLCRDADKAMDSIKSCSEKVKRGERCGQPHVISLILPATAAGLEVENDTNIEPALAEVQCEILSVAKLPNPGKDIKPGMGRVVGAVSESRTVMVQ